MTARRSSGIASTFTANASESAPLLSGKEILRKHKIRLSMVNEGGSMFQQGKKLETASENGIKKSKMWIAHEGPEEEKVIVDDDLHELMRGSSVRAKWHKEVIQKEGGEVVKCRCVISCNSKVRGTLQTDI